MWPRPGKSGLESFLAPEAGPGLLLQASPQTAWRTGRPSPGALEVHRAVRKRALSPIGDTRAELGGGHTANSYCREPRCWSEGERAGTLDLPPSLGRPARATAGGAPDGACGLTRLCLRHGPCLQKGKQRRGKGGPRTRRPSLERAPPGQAPRGTHLYSATLLRTASFSCRAAMARRRCSLSCSISRSERVLMWFSST